jgi:hypothetical protein
MPVVLRLEGTIAGYEEIKKAFEAGVLEKIAGMEVISVEREPVIPKPWTQVRVCEPGEDE